MATTKVKTNKFEGLLDALTSAKISHDLTAMTTEDGGACNFDKCYIVWDARWGRLTKKSLAAFQAEAALIGVRADRGWGYHSHTVHLDFGPTPQGFAQTEAAKAARDGLKAHGFEAGVHYAVD